MRNAIQLKKFFLAWLTALWSVAAVASQSTFAADMSSIPIEAVGWTVLLSFIGGAAFTTNKISRPNIVVKSIPLEMTKDILMSLVAGLITFFLCSFGGLPYWLQAAFITLSGYGGSKVLDKYLSKGLDLVDNVAPSKPRARSGPALAGGGGGDVIGGLDGSGDGGGDGGD